MRILLLVCSLILTPLLSKAQCFETQSHIYRLDEETSTLTRLHKVNHRIETIRVGMKPASLTFYKNYGFVLNKESSTLTIFKEADPRCQKDISLDKSPSSFVLQKNLGYVFHELTGSLTIIDLTYHLSIGNLSLPKGASTLKCHETMGYIFNSESRILSVVDLKKATVKKSICFSSEGTNLIFYQKNLIIGNGSSIHIYNAKAELIEKVPLPFISRHVSSYKSTCIFSSITSSSLAILDLETNKIQTLNLDCFDPSSFIFADTSLFIEQQKSTQNYVEIDLIQGRVVRSFSTPQPLKKVYPYQGHLFALDVNTTFFEISTLNTDSSQSIRLEKPPIDCLFSQKYIVIVTPHSWDLYDFATLALVHTFAKDPLDTISLKDGWIYSEGMRLYPLPDETIRISDF